MGARRVPRPLPRGALEERREILEWAATLTITAAALTITADDQFKVYGDAVSTLTASYSGFVNGDDASSLNHRPHTSRAERIGFC